jgi:hypothetical protein
MSPMLQNGEQAGGRRTRAAEDRNFLGIIGLLICAAPGGMAGTTAEVRPGEALTGEPSVRNLVC